MSRRPPLLGYNHNVRHAGRLFHVQTEDYGLGRPLIVTQVFFQGTILATARTTYPESALEEVVQRMMQAQHKQLLKQLRDGGIDIHIESVLSSSSPPPPTPEEVALSLEASRAAAARVALLLESLIPLDDPRAAEEGTPFSSELLGNARRLRSRPPEPSTDNRSAARIETGARVDPSAASAPVSSLSLATTGPLGTANAEAALLAALEAVPLAALSGEQTIPVPTPPVHEAPEEPESTSTPPYRVAAPRAAPGRMGIAAYMGAVQPPESWVIPSINPGVPNSGRPAWSAADPSLGAPTVAERPPQSEPIAPVTLARPGWSVPSGGRPPEGWPIANSLSDIELSELISLADIGPPLSASSTSPARSAVSVEVMGPREEPDQVLELLAEPPGEDELPPNTAAVAVALNAPPLGVIQSHRIPRLPSQMTPPQMAQILNGFRGVRSRPVSGRSGVVMVPSRRVPDASVTARAARAAAAGPPTKRPAAVPMSIEPEQTQAHPITGVAQTTAPRLSRPLRAPNEGMVHARPTAEGVVLRPAFVRPRPSEATAEHEARGSVIEREVRNAAVIEPASRGPISSPLASLDERTLDQVILEYLAEEVSGRKGSGT